MMDSHIPHSIRSAGFPYGLLQEVFLIPRLYRISWCPHISIVRNTLDCTYHRNSRSAHHPHSDSPWTWPLAESAHARQCSSKTWHCSRLLAAFNSWRYSVTACLYMPTARISCICILATSLISSAILLQSSSMFRGSNIASYCGLSWIIAIFYACLHRG